MLSLRLIALFLFTAALLVYSDKASAQDEAAAADVRPVIETETKATLEDVLAWSYDNNPTLRAARSELKAVQEELPLAQSGWKPLVDASGNITSVETDGSNFGGDGSTSKELDLSLSQPLYRGGRTMAAVDRAQDTIMAQRFLLKAAEQEVLLAVATAYVDVLRDQAVLELAQNNEVVLTRELEATQDRFDVGELTRTDVAQAKARLADANANRIRASGNLRSSMAVYEQVVGLPPENLAPPSVRLPVPDALDEAITVAENSNPLVLTSEYIHRSAEENIDEVFGELLPTLSLFGGWNQQYDPQPGLIDETTSQTIGVSATVPLYEAGAVRSRVRQAKHVANQRYLEILETRRNIRQEVITSWENLETARAEIESRKAQVEATELAQEGVRAETVLGSRSVLDVLDAEQEFLDARVALLTARRNETVARFNLAATLGLLNPAVLQLTSYAAEYDSHLRDIQGKILGMDVEQVRKTP